MRRLGLLKLCNHVLFALALTSTLVGTAVSAAPVIEVESNDSIATAQSIDGFFDLAFDPLIEDAAGFNTSTTVPHAEVISHGQALASVDYFSFAATAGSFVTLDIDCAEFLFTGCTIAGNVAVDAWIELYDPAGNLFALNDDSDIIIDTGSNLSTLDSFLNVPLNVSGTWTVAVGSFNLLNVVPSFGSYELNVSLVPEPSQSVLLGAGLLGLLAIARRRF